MQHAMTTHTKLTHGGFLISKYTVVWGPRRYHGFIFYVFEACPVSYRFHGGFIVGFIVQSDFTRKSPSEDGFISGFKPGFRVGFIACVIPVS